MIILKSDDEIEKMRVAGGIVADTLSMIEREISPGITTGEIDRLVDEFIRGKGAIPSFKDYHGYPASACVSVNEVIVHGIPGKRRLEEGDIVSIDVGAYIDGFHGDAARTFPVGKVSEEAQKLIDVTRQSFFEGLKFVKVGNRLEDISSAVQTFAEKNGFSVVREFVGHGIGRDMHESPDVPNYGTPGRGIRLKKGLVIAIEPMILAGSRYMQVLDDGWTAVTQDGKMAAHYENTVALTENGPQILTLRDWKGETE